MTDLVKYFRGKEKEMLALLETLVAFESPSVDKKALDALSEYLAGVFGRIGCKVNYIEDGTCGKHLVAEWGNGPSTTLVLCHMDTVCPLGEISKRPFRIESGIAYGPGVMDMKGGIVQGCFALKSVVDRGLSGKRIIFLLNSDEELGSPSSMPHILQYAKMADNVLVLEPPVGLEGALKTARKGAAIFKIRIKGKSAHAGAEPEKGISALQELAFQILNLHSLNDFDKGTTVNVGLAGGGTRSNVVAEHAWAEIDVRIATMSEAERITGIIRSLKPSIKGIEMEVEGGINRPPMERTAKIVRLFHHARGIASSELGFDLSESATGGFSDGNLTAALDVPTLDGLGAVGAGGHSENEFILVEHLPKRTALLTRLFETL